MDDMRAELENMKQQISTFQQQPPIVFLVKAEVHVAYGSPVVWSERKGEYQAYIVRDSLKNVQGWSCVDLAYSQKRAIDGYIDVPKIYTGHLRPR